jgi:hypothetical protein
MRPTKSPNHALQRTGSAVTAPAADHHRLSTHRQVPRPLRLSLSLGLFGDITRILPMMIYPDRRYSQSVEASFDGTEASQASDAKGAIQRRVTDHKSVHTLLADAREAYERWNAAKAAIDAKSQGDVYGLPPRVQVVAACFNYFLALDEINAHDDRNSKQASASHRISIISLVIGIAGLVFAALTYFGIIPAFHP